MPYKLLRNDDGSYRVVNEVTGDVKAKNTTKEKGEAQIRFLHAEENDPSFVPRRQRRSMRRR